MENETVYLVARHDGPGGWNNAEAYLGFGWEILDHYYVPQGLALLKGPKVHATWQAQRLASGMLLRNGDGRGAEPYATLDAALIALIENEKWWM